MSDTMLAGVVRELGGALDVSEVAIPEPGFNEVLVKNIASGVCHTDLHARNGDWPVKPNPPFIPGHEGVGRVVKVGPGVEDLKEGDLVGNAWLWRACGRCRQCRTGWETLCPTPEFGGYTKDGSFGQYMLVDATFAPRIPDGVDTTAIAPILCAGVTVYKGLKVTDTKPGDWVAISGIGGLGHIAVDYAHAMGMKVAAIDVAEDKLDLAQRHGAEITINAKEKDPAKVLHSELGGVDGVLVTAVHPSAFAQAVGMTRPGGTVSLNGLPPGDFPLDIFDVVLRGITVRGSLVGTRQDMVEAIQFFADGKIKPTVTARELGEINDIFDEMEHGKIDGRVVMTY